ncbi:MAG: hypothetical protein ACLPUO_09030 [Streptosporangiaceae bacterium]
MKAPAGAAQRSAGRLLRWYPRSWRDRYGDEFAELLVAEFAERPVSWRRTADVIRAGLLARLTGAGLTSHAAEPAAQIRASLATVSCALAVFAAFGAAIWSQLTTSWQWQAPHAAATRAAIAVMSAAALVAIVLIALAAVPAVCCAAGSVMRRRDGHLARPAALAAAAAAVLLAGSHHFENGWPGTGGTAHSLLAPGGVAAFSWASTLSVSSYWGHLGELGAFPAAEVAWMTVSPLAWLGLAAGIARTLRRLRMPRALLAYEARLAAAAAVAMAGFAAGAALWVFGEGGQAGLFHAGVVDVAGLMVMLLALGTGARAAASARQARLALPAS